MERAIIFTDSRGICFTKKRRINASSWVEIVCEKMKYKFDCYKHTFVLDTFVRLDQMLSRTKNDYHIGIIQLGIHDHVGAYPKGVWQRQLVDTGYKSGEFRFASIRNGKERFWYEDRDLYDAILKRIQKRIKYIVWVPLHDISDKKANFLRDIDDIDYSVQKSKWVNEYYGNMFLNVDISQTGEWKKKYVVPDGLHYHKKGHKEISKIIMRTIKERVKQ